MENRVESIKGKLYVIAAFVLAGSSVIAARFVAGHMGPFTVTFLSLAFAIAAATPISGRDMLRTLGRLGRGRLRLLCLQAFFGIFLFRVFLALGLRHATVAEAGIVTGTAPAMTAILAFSLLREPVAFRHAAGVLASLIGMYFMQGRALEDPTPAGGHWLGIGLILCATACEALFAVIARTLHKDETARAERLAPVTHAGIVSFLAMLMCFLPMLLEKPAAALARLPLSGWAALVWYGAVVTVVAFACMFAGARRCDGYTISACIGFMPASALILSMAILGETVSSRQVAGCVCILASILILGHKTGGATEYEERLPESPGEPPK